MIEFIYGVPSSGKTTLLYEKIRDKLRAGKEAVLIVPDQEALDAEAALTRFCRGVPTLGLRVYGFSRLADDVFRKYGGVSYDYIDKTGQILAMFLSVCSVSPALKVYGKISPADSSLLSALLSAVRELKRQGVTAADTARAAETVGSSALADKLSDISLIMPAYERVMSRRGDDPDDVLGRLYSVLSAHGGMPGVSVYVDSFVSFTAVQNKILELLMKTCDDFAVTFGIPGPKASDDRFGLLSPVCDSERKLRAAAGRCGELRSTVIGGTHASPGMAALERALRLGGKETFSPCGGCVRFFRSANEFDSAELVAADICRRLREGVRCREIAVLCRDVSAWRGIIDAALERYGVPCYISSRDDARQKALFRLILSALSVCENDFRTRDVCCCVKTGLLPVPTGDLDLFDDYISRRGVKGAKAFTSDFTGSPDRFGLPSSEAAAERLKRINETREAVIAPLADLQSDIKECVTAKDISSAVVRFLSRLNMTETLDALRRDAAARGDIEEAEQIGQLWNVFASVTGQLCAFCGDLPMNAGRYKSLLDTVLSETDIGKIPTSTDQVTVGESGMLRVRGVKHVYLIGCCEGEFPGAVQESGLFGDSDRAALSEAGIELEAGTDRQNERQLYDFYRCACSGSETATFCYSTGSSGRGGEKRPSHPLSDIKRAFPDAETVAAPDICDIAASAASAFEYFAAHCGTPEGKAMEAVLGSDPRNAEKLAALAVPLTSGRGSLSGKTVRSLLPGDVRLSPTRLTSFTGCAFSHCCGYYLRLDSGADIGFNAAEFGDFVHFVLRCIAEDCIRDESVIRLRGAGLEALVDKYIEIYCKTVLGAGASYQTGRTRAMIRRLRKCVLTVAEDVLNELEKGKFRPVATELEFGGRNGLPALELTMNGGRKAYLTGKADRVDTYEHDGVTYVKLVDYKTGRIDFRQEKLAEADKSVQLFIYMMTACSSSGIAKDPAPGALFYMAAAPEAQIVEKSGEEPKDAALPRGGMASSDGVVRDALDPDMDEKGGRIYSVKAGGMIFADRDGMDDVFNEVRLTVTDAAERMCGGDVSVTSKNRDDAPCKYCRFVSVCRYTEKKKRKGER